MKTFSTETPPRVINRGKAWAYFIANATLCPGMGSLLARRWSGVFELGLALVGAIIAIIPMWDYLSAYARTMEPPDDAGYYLKRAMLGWAIFITGWVWSIVTGIRILRASKEVVTSPPLMKPPQEPFTGPVA